MRKKGSNDILETWLNSNQTVFFSAGLSGFLLYALQIFRGDLPVAKSPRCLRPQNPFPAQNNLMSLMLLGKHLLNIDISQYSTLADESTKVWERDDLSFVTNLVSGGARIQSHVFRQKSKNQISFLLSTVPLTLCV